MKTARFLVMAFGALALGVGYAGEPSSQSSEQVLHQNHTTGDPSAKPAQGKQEGGKIDQTPGKDLKPKEDNHHSKLKEDGRASEKGGKAGPVKPQVKRPSEKEPHQPERKRAATAANEGLMKNKTENHREQPARLATGRGATAPLPGGVRGRSATTTAAGRAASASAKHSSLALNGSDMIKRKR
jgi:hypothetical protein